MSAESIARALGGRRVGHGWLVCCPSHEDRHPSLSLADGDSGLLVKCFADEARDPRGTVAERYLAGRGLTIDGDIAGRVLRFHPACPFGPGARLPCMVGLYRDLRTDAPRAIHRTALSPDGRKLDRKMWGPTAGAAIKLSADDDVELGLCVGEGIETCLAAKALGISPIWAMGCAGGIEHLPVLGGIEGLTILAENNDDGQPNLANDAAVRACARRWNAAGVDIEVLQPIGPGDANDVLLRGCGA